MRTKKQVFRWAATRLPSPDSRRIVVLTGARQTGKTTLARREFDSLRYVNLDAVEEREAIQTIRTSTWASTVGPAVLDEAQKEPSVFDKVKWAYDEGEIDFSVLLGSSRILLLGKIQESLAGRAFLYDLWPLMASELRHEAGQPPKEPLLHRIIVGKQSFNEILSAEPQLLLGSEDAERWEALEHLAAWGGMPGLLPLDDEDRRVWLRSYQQTYLERDLSDLTRLSDLRPFRSLQRLCMLRTGQLLSYSELARDAGLSPSTARRYLEYLRISYQTVLLQPYGKNLTSSVIKSPKLYWVDLGLLRQGTQQWGAPTGAMFETLAVGELHKWMTSMAEEAELYFYRTRSGMEADLILQTRAGVIGIEIKNRSSVVKSDARSLRAIAERLGSEWLGGLIVYRGRDVSQIFHKERIWTVPLHRLV